MNRFAGTACFLVSCCAAALACSALVLLLAMRWFPDEALLSVWLGFVSVPVGLSFAALIPYQRSWADSGWRGRSGIVMGCAAGLALLHWMVVLALVSTLPAG